MNHSTIITVSIAFFLCGVAASYGDPIFNESTGHWYEIVGSGDDGSWDEAEANAIANGGHLVTINDASEELWLQSTFGASEYFWIGFNDAAVEGEWVWANEEPVTYTNWSYSQPDNATPPSYGEDYAIMNWGASAWNDWDHLRPDYFYTNGIAEYPASVPEPAIISFLFTGCLSLFLYGAKQRNRKS